MKNVFKEKTKLEVILQPMERGQITLPKAIREAAGITPNTWLKVSYLPSGKIQVEVAEESNSGNQLVKALINLKKAKLELWTDEDDKTLKQADEKSKEDIRRMQKIW